MKIINPIGKEIKIMPVGGGTVYTGKLIQLTENFAILGMSKNEQRSISLKGMRMDFTTNSIIDMVERDMGHKISNPDVRDLVGRAVQSVSSL